MRSFCINNVDNCQITGENQAIALRGSNGEQNIKLSIGNSTLNLDTSNCIRVGNDTFSIYYGFCNNFSVNKVQRSGCVIETGESYRFNYYKKCTYSTGAFLFVNKKKKPRISAWFPNGDTLLKERKERKEDADFHRWKNEVAT